MREMLSRVVFRNHRASMITGQQLRSHVREFPYILDDVRYA